MTQYDFMQIAKLLLREDVDIKDRLIDMENTYQMFHRYDEFDFLELLRLKQRQNYQAEFEVKLLNLCNYLMHIEGNDF